MAEAGRPPIRRATPDALAEAAEALRAGRLVAMPTETVYGLAAVATDPAAVSRIFEAKGRPAGNPLIVHVPDAERARACARAWPPEAEALARAFWPGPLTLLLPKAPHIPDAVTAGLDAVGLRVPAHPVARALLEAVGLPVAAPSANPYMGVSPTRAAHVAAGLAGRGVALVLEGGKAEVGLESTVLDLTGPRPRILRPGGVPREAIEAVLGRPLAPGGPQVVEGAAAPSPGLAKRHYAPRTPLLPFDPAAEGAGWPEALASGTRGLLGRAGDLAGLQGPHVVALPDDPAGFGAALYDALHTLDAAALEAIGLVAVPETPAWEAVRDRLSRARS